MNVLPCIISYKILLNSVDESRMHINLFLVSFFVLTPISCRLLIFDFLFRILLHNHLRCFDFFRNESEASVNGSFKQEMKNQTFCSQIMQNLIALSFWFCRTSFTADSDERSQFVDQWFVELHTSCRPQNSLQQTWKGT